MMGGAAAGTMGAGPVGTVVGAASEAIGEVGDDAKDLWDKIF